MQGVFFQFFTYKEGFGFAFSGRFSSASLSTGSSLLLLVVLTTCFFNYMSV